MGSNDTLRLYPRGFLGGNLKPQIESSPRPFDDVSHRHQYAATDYSSGNTTIVPNPDVEALYITYVKNSVNTGSPAFRSRILAVALNAFGTKNFLTWYLSQFSSPAAGDLHNRFLTDTIKFISTGVRDMPLENWAALLLITESADSIGKIPDTVKPFFGIRQDEPFNNARFNIQLTDVIQTWCSKEGGLEDLLGTLHILFGNF
jgi:hypothetical protein